ncbi:ChaN family lipoprotein [Cellvibrio mixtus]|uniref:ChaN family lipoprotein n=1 Tax=Cellvibrio mixtus TaxID=39650 RepID=UPI0012699DEB|nr:ChaN family lipoprotein [Cellvibrio mixtus]
MRKYTVSGLWIILLLILSGCSQFLTQPALQAADIKEGALYDLRSQTPVSRDQLINNILASDYVVLGERHDNPQHHELQLWVLQQLQAQQWLTQLSLEMITPQQQKNFTALSPALAENKAALQKALAWPDDGWPWNDYDDLVQLAVKNSIPLSSANVDQDEIKALYKGDKPSPHVLLSPEAKASLLRDIEESHCGFIKEPQTSNMLSVQLARDDAMVTSLLHTKRGAALIAGAFHARKDLGFPLHLQQRAAGKTLVSLAFVESDEVATQEKLAALAQQYDVIWVTPVHTREDPCAAFTKSKS